MSSDDDNQSGGSDRTRTDGNDTYLFRGQPPASLFCRVRTSGDDSTNNNNNVLLSMSRRDARPLPPPPAAAAAAVASAASAPSNQTMSARSAAAYSYRDSNNNGNGGASFEFAAAKTNNKTADELNEDTGRFSEEDGDDDTALKRLLHRLKREYVSNVGKNSNNAGNINSSLCRPNKQRARYLLEASAGNVGLAAALYWEDYLAAESAADQDGAERHHDRDEDGRNNNSAPAKKRSRDDDSSNSNWLSATSAPSAKKPARKNTSGMDVDNSITNNNGDDDRLNQSRSALTSMRQFQQELGDKLSSLQERLSSLPSYNTTTNNSSSNNNINSNHNNNIRAPSENINLDEFLAAAASSSASRGGPALTRRSSYDSTATVPGRGGGPPPPPYLAGNLNVAQQRLLQQQQQQQQQQGAAGVAAAGALYPDIMRLGFSEENFAAAAAASAGVNGRIPSAMETANSGFASAARDDNWDAFHNAALQVDIPRYLLRQQQRGGEAAAGGGGGVWDQIISRALANPGRLLESDEARAFLAALAADSAHVGINNNPAAAAGGGNGGDPDGGDDDNDDDINVFREERDHGHHGNQHGNRRENADDNPEAPLRRSLRLSSARRRNAARAAALELHQMSIRRRLERRNDNERALAAGEDHNVSGSDDETFMSGPVPVFRKGVTSSATKSDSTPSKWKELDHSNPKHRLYGDSDDESTNALDSVWIDVDDFLYGSEDYPLPSRVLWDSFPPQNLDDENLDEDSPGVIPISWLRSGFKLSECGNGLAMCEPPEDVWDNIRRSLPQNVRDCELKDVKSLFPYNCKGVSAMLALGTALLYSGVSLQKGTVSTDVDRVPFDELSLEERRKQFDARLEDVLSSLIFVAAKAGAQRCLKKLEKCDKFLARRKMDPEEQSFYLQKRQQLEKRTHLCNVCWWDVESTTGTTSFPAGKDPADVNINNSFTNINDIKSYVRTHLRSFKEPGGCALLLETIIRCHGVEYTEPNLVGYCDLLVCSCNESLTHVGSSNFYTNASTDDCMTPQLLSLLLTGEAQTSYQDWSADAFGIGLLRINNDDVPSNKLLRPLKQIWLCQGDTGYSTLFLQKKNFFGREDSLDETGKGFQLAHWNCWSSELSTFKVISTTFEATPITSTVSDDSEEEGRCVIDSISARIRKEHKRNLTSPCSNGAGNHSPITDDELKSLRFHPDDEKYYPDQYRRWRFYFGSKGADTPIPADAWIPFYRLRGRQRMIVETQVAPRIVSLVRNRWPMATVRDFSPSGQYPIV